MVLILICVQSYCGGMNNVPIVRDRNVGLASMKAVTPAREPFVLSMMAKARVPLLCARIPQKNDAMKLSKFSYGPYGQFLYISG